MGARPRSQVGPPMTLGKMRANSVLSLSLGDTGHRLLARPRIAPGRPGRRRSRSRSHRGGAAGAKALGGTIGPCLSGLHIHPPVLVFFIIAHQIVRHWRRCPGRDCLKERCGSECAHADSNGRWPARRAAVSEVVAGVSAALPERCCLR
jgi:hypothetical protein